MERMCPHGWVIPIPTTRRSLSGRAEAARPVGAENRVTSSDLHVLVYSLAGCRGAGGGAGVQRHRGHVTDLSLVERQLSVRTDEDEDIDYDGGVLDELQHAYAITVHRSQGSEYPAVVVPLTMSAYALLQRNLLYTAVTRAKRLVVLVGSRKALAVAVRTAGTGRRHTALTHRLLDPATSRA